MRFLSIYCIALLLASGYSSARDKVTGTNEEVINFKPAKVERAPAALAAEPAALRANSAAPSSPAEDGLYPFTSYDPEKNDEQTTGTFCIRCYGHSLRGANLQQQAQAIRDHLNNPPEDNK